MDKLEMRSKDIVKDNIGKIGNLFPDVIKETEKGLEIDFDALKQELSNEILDSKKERYELTWPGKKEAKLEINIPTKKTLRPIKEKSVNFDNTENIYIEGDNLEVLKILQESYLNKIKCIYIDPPYNTGKDFIYTDNFDKTTEEELIQSGQVDETGKRLITNTETRGRYHSDWLSMMYPVLKLARDILTNDGVIFISIDENEVVNLMKLCDEIFGESNFIENFVWIKNSTKNLSKTTSTNHEYILCYVKNRQEIEKIGFFRKKKEGLEEVNTLLREFEIMKLPVEEAEKKLKDFYKKNKHLKGISSYDKLMLSEQKHLKAYTLDNASAPKASGVGAMYDVIHPITRKVCKKPVTGWRFTEKTMNELIEKDLIYFYEDETYVPRYKRFLDTVETEVIKSTFEDFKDGKKELVSLFQTAIFENAKPTTLLKKFISLTKKDDIILDFFSGSATTAHAVMQLNAEDGGNRKYIMVQLDEETDEKSEAYKAGYKYITDIGEERIRRAAKKIKEETNADIDYGFRVYKLDSSNMNDVYYKPDEYKQDQLGMFEDNIKEDRSDLDILTQVMLDLGLTLDLKIAEKEINGHKVYFVENNSLIASFSNITDISTIDEMCKDKPLKLVFRESSFKTDEDKINIQERVKKLSPETEISIL